MELQELVVLRVQVVHQERQVQAVQVELQELMEQVVVQVHQVQVVRVGLQE